MNANQSKGYAMQIGEKAPDFTLPDANGAEFSLSENLGRGLVVYFYPKDDTPGCTKEAIEFTDMKGEFDALGITIIGISKDTPAKHGKFSAKHDLDVTLLSDAESDVCERYGTWGEKRMYGKTLMGIERATFLIDATGTLRQIWRKVKVPGHVADVLEQARAL